MDELLVHRAGAYRAESWLRSVAIPDAGSDASFLAERTEAGLAANSVRIIPPNTPKQCRLKRYGMSWWSETWPPSSVVLVLIMEGSAVVTR